MTRFDSISGKALFVVRQYQPWLLLGVPPEMSQDRGDGFCFLAPFEMH